MVEREVGDRLEARETRVGGERRDAVEHAGPDRRGRDRLVLLRISDEEAGPKRRLARAAQRQRTGAKGRCAGLPVAVDREQRPAAILGEGRAVDLCIEADRPRLEAADPLVDTKQPLAPLQVRAEVEPAAVIPAAEGGEPAAVPAGIDPKAEAGIALAAERRPGGQRGLRPGPARAAGC